VWDGEHRISEARGRRGDEVRMRNAPLPSGGALLALVAEKGMNVDAPWTLHFAVEPPLAGAEREPNDTPERGTVLDGESGSIAGFLWPGDLDWYRLRGGARAAKATFEVASPPGVEARVAAAWAPAEKRMRVEIPLPAGGEAVVLVAGRARDTAFDAPYTLSWSTAPDEAAPAP
jgi:hypothetical protein